MKTQRISEALFDSAALVTEWLSLLETLPLYGQAFAMPKDSGAKTALARLLVAILASSAAPVALYVSAWGIWSSSENMELFDSYRMSKGESRKLGEVPLHVFESPDDPALLGIICFALYFMWDVDIFTSNSECLVTLSHDEWLEIRTSAQSAIEICNLAIETRRLQSLEPLL